MAGTLPAGVAAQAAVGISIERQSLSDALLAFSRQTGKQILFAPDLVSGKQSRAVRGPIDVERALALLLKGSGLRARQTPSGAFLIVADGNAPVGASAAPVQSDRAADTQAASSAETPPPPAPAEDIIVVGTAGGGTRRQDAAFAVTSIDSAVATRLGAASTAEALRVVPGVSVESSGGKNGANIFVRGYPSGGDAEYVTFQSEGVPFFPPPTLSFLENTQLIRIDETIKRIDAVRGGTGSLFSSGQPGLTVNLVQREGGSTPEALAKLSATDFGELRLDGYVSGQIADRTYAFIGGYYAAAHGVRDPQFEAEEGGQITANIRHDFDRGSILIFGRYLNDKGQWLLTVPVVQDGNKISAYPGFDPGTGTLAGIDTRYGVRNDGSRFDLADGRGAKLGNVGTNIEFELAEGLTARDKFSYLNGDANTTGLVPGGTPPQSASAFAAGLGGTIGSLTYANGGGAVSGAQPVVQAGLWTVRKQIEAYVNDFTLEWKTGRNKLTGGVYYTRYSSADQWNLGNSFLLTATPNAQRLNLTLSDGRVVTRDGFTSCSFFNVNATYTGEDLALYGVDEFNVTDKLKVDAGIRWQQHTVNGTLENNGAAPAAGFDGNPLTLYDNGDAYLNGTFSTLQYKGDRISYTVGANYEFTRAVSVFARYSRGNSFPFFDNLRDGIRVAPRVDTYEGGVKISSGIANLYVTAFHNDFTGLATTVITSGAPIASIGGAKATGVEVEGELRPFRGASIAGSATYLDAKYQDFFTTITDAMGNPQSVDLTGNTVQRQPRWQWRVTPAYETSLGGDWRASVFATIGYYGKRFSDVNNNQVLPSYYKLDAGASVELNRHLTLSVFGDNLTDSIGLTEGNPRTLGAQGTGVILARPILGRSFRFSATFKL
ncbi:MAG: TonB-dependent receptor [Sphingomonas sp. 28-66-16]|nr:MAG: TonB-dependent receptor [Sphingomonas sp. 28-66-16]